MRREFGNKLPHENTIRQWILNSDSKGEPGIDESHMKKLKTIATEFKKMHGVPLLCSLIFDEINIRKQIFWSSQTSKYVGLVENKQTDQTDEQSKSMCKQAIVYLLNGLNGCVEFPVAFYFIDTLNKTERKDRLLQIIEVVTETGVKISNITCDGLSSNISMYELLGANLDITSKTYQPSFRNAFDNAKIYIIFDPCHMEKLVRNTLAGKGVFYDDQNNKIKWKYFEKLYEYSKEHKVWSHKMSKKHMQWKNNIMNVRVAVQTMSESVATTMEVLMRNGHQDFIHAGATIRFIRVMNNLFDIFNSSTRTNNSNLFKNPLSTGNKRIIFDFFDTTINYLKSLRIDEKRVIAIKNNNNISETREITTKIPIITSRNKTGFRGFCIDMESLKSMYLEYIEDKKYLNTIATYNIQQDCIEMFFGRIRSHCGYNNNPNMDQFRGAYRKLLTNIKVVLSGYSNCRLFDVHLPEAINYSNIYFVSSKRATIIPTDTDSFIENYETQKDSILQDAAKIVELESCYHLIDGSYDLFNVYIAALIEQNISNCSRFYCEQCKEVFAENDKIFINPAWNILNGYKPCKSTVEVCKVTEKFFRLYNIQKNKYDFNVVYCLIFRTMDFSALYSNSAFDCDISHKYQFLKCIVGQYIIRKATDFGKELTYDQYENIFRQRLNRLVLFTGQ